MVRTFQAPQSVHTYVKPTAAQRSSIVIMLPGLYWRWSQVERRMSKPPAVVLLIVRRVPVVSKVLSGLHLLRKIMCELET